MNNLRELTTAELREQCPNVFVKTPIAKASDRYQVIDMQDVISIMREMGWFVHDTIVPRSKTHGAKSQFMLRFANERFMNQENAKEVLIQSSHNLRKAFTPMMGNFTFICENGMVVGKEFVKGLNRVLHIGDAREKVMAVLELIEAETDKLDGAFERMKLKVLTEDEMKELAAKAFQHFDTKVTDPNMDLIVRTALATAVNPNGELLEEQEGNSLYSVYQRIQGNFTKGRILTRKHGSVEKLEKAFDNAELEGNQKLMEKISMQLAEAEATKDIIPFGENQNLFFRKLTVPRNMNKLTKFNQNLFSEALALV
jgi:uncharacterized protein (UPF0147 family)